MPLRNVSSHTALDRKTHYTKIDLEMLEVQKAHSLNPGADEGIHLAVSTTICLF